ncbi:unnamed protein product, partial [Rhizoctonia solani]
MVNCPLMHIVFIPGPPWGHLSPGMKTALRLVEKFQDLFITLFVYRTELGKATKYLSAQPSAYTRRIRVVSDSTEGPSVSSGQVVEMITSLEVAFGTWITNESRLIIEDLFTGGVSLTCKNVHNLPVVGWWLMPAGSLVAFLKMMNISQEEILSANSSTRGAQSSSSLTKASQVDSQDVHDQLVSIPGIPLYYEWEFFTQDVLGVQSLSASISARWKNMLTYIDTIFCCTTFEMEPIVAAALPNAFGKALRTFYVGPSVDLAPPHQPDPISPITQFLDRAYTDNGAHSVIYVAFGTLYFPLPRSMSHLMAALDEIPKAGFRFIFALS